MKKENPQLKLNITIDLDRKWARNLTEDELRAYLQNRLDYCLGFRGKVKKLSKPRKI